MKFISFVHSTKGTFAEFAGLLTAIAYSQHYSQSECRIPFASVDAIEEIIKALIVSPIYNITHTIMSLFYHNYLLYHTFTSFNHLYTIQYTYMALSTHALNLYNVYMYMCVRAV